MTASNPEGAQGHCVVVDGEDGLPSPPRRRPSSRTGKHAEYHYWHNFEVRGKGRKGKEEARKWMKEDLKRRRAFGSDLELG